jgi:hypothetical protein
MLAMHVPSQVTSLAKLITLLWLLDCLNANLQWQFLQARCR